MARRHVVDRPKERVDDWGNQNLGLCCMKLPLNVTDPVECLRESHKRLHSLKTSAEPIVANWLLSIIGSVPQRIIRPLFGLLTDKVSTSISNVPGLVHPIKWPVAPDGNINETMAGVGTYKETYFFVPPTMRIGPFVTIVSYCGEMYYSIAANQRLLSQDQITRIVRESIPDILRRLDRDLPQLTH